MDENSQLVELKLYNLPWKKKVSFVYWFLIEVLLSYNIFLLNDGKIRMALALFEQRPFINWVM